MVGQKMAPIIAIAGRCCPRSSVFPGRSTRFLLLLAVSLVVLVASGCGEQFGEALTADRYYDLPDIAKATVYRNPVEAKELANELQL